TPLLYLWDFGDNTTSLQRSPTKLYPNSGTYPVSLVIEDTIGCRDTLIRPSYITIADPDVSIAADTTQATCPPLLVRFTATPNSPHPFNAWNWDFGNNNSSAVQNPSNLYTVPGKYGVSLIATAASGCADTVLLPDSIILGGPFGSFSFAPQSGCEGQQIAFTTTTTRNTASIAIDANDGNIVPGTIGLPVLHTYQDSGVYIPTMILRDSLGCTVSIPSTSGITIFPTPNVNFSSPDTALCDSGVVRFFDQSTSSTILNNWQWDFGDGGSGTGQTPTHNYRDTGSFPVQLIVTSIHGCVDSLEKPAFVNVRQSPIPVIGLSDTAGCPPFNLLTSDLSPSSNAPIARWVWDFGVPGGRSVQQNADYTYTSPGVYPVTLTIRDQFNCEGTTDTTVQVWTPPAADFIVDGDSFGCAPVTLQFLDRSGTVVDWNWEFGDGGRAIEQNPTHTYKSDGTYSVTLQVTDSNGCVTQVNKPNYIQLDHPIADFTADPLTGCPGLQVTFLDQSQSDTSLVSWLWDFGDSNQGTGTPTQHIYNNSGKFDVSLKVTDFFGCQDSITKPELIDILLSLQPTPPAITRVTVTSDSEVVLDYERYNNDLDDFAYYVIERATGGGNFIPLDSIENIRQVRYRDQGLDTRNNVYCYRLRVVNYCEFASDPLASEPHCSIQLTTTAQTDQIQLNWTPYIGWPSVAEYRIYRVLNYNMSSAQQIAVVPGTVTSFLDTDMFCYDPVTYRIEAIHPSDALNSLSNIDRETPIHFPSPFPMHMVRATVVNDQFVQLNWSIPQTINPSKIRIEKRDGNVFRPLVEFPFDSPPLSYDDLETNVDNQPYEYRAFVVDSCGDLNPVGRTARSIWLTGERTNGRIFLRWTPYKEWEEGVSFYQLEVFNEASGNFEFLDNVTPEDSLYEDTQTDFPQGSYCYRVTAFEEAGTDTFSLSNETCVIIDPEIYTPNAFTPNGDLVNDIFEIKGVFFDNFHLQIWSRWGLKIYESRNMAEGWNGKVNGTADAPEGVYVFIATGTGFNGDPVRKVGTITLIR
ncbi:MAG: PKD domain-containing protein, partial [Bacteroidota bacterium]